MPRLSDRRQSPTSQPGSAFELVSPVDGSTYATRRFTTDGELASLLAQSARAQQEWKKRPLSERVAFCREAVARLSADATRLGEELTWMMGRPCAHTGSEFTGVRERADYLLSIAAEALAEKMFALDGTELAKVTRASCGTVLVIAPWNYPYLTAINSIIPSLVAGNALIIKHSPQTAIVAERLCQAFHDAGIPQAVVTFAHCTNEQVHALISSVEIGHVVFTGSVAVGRLIGGIAGQSLTGCTLELGGSDAAYVRDDADAEKTAAALVDGAYFNAGQSCCAVERIYVARDRYTEFVNAFTERAARLKLGDPRERDTSLGPVVSLAAAARIRSLVRDAEHQATTVFTPIDFTHGELPPTYLPPYIVLDPVPDARIAHEESFGPVVTVAPVDSDAAAVSAINASRFGLTASIWTGEANVANNTTNNIVDNIGRQLEVGTWYVNRCDYLAPCLPWSGRKESGLGCSLGESGFHEVSRPKACLKQAL